MALVCYEPVWFSPNQKLPPGYSVGKMNNGKMRWFLSNGKGVTKVSEEYSDRFACRRDAFAHSRGEA